MTTSPDTATETPTHLAHDDPRAQSILVLAESYNDETTLTTADKDMIVLVILPNVPPAQAVNTFRMIADDLATVADYDTRGAVAVEERHGRWVTTSNTVGLSADDFASEQRDQLRADARANTAMLVTLQDTLAAGAA